MLAEVAINLDCRKIAEFFFGLKKARSIVFLVASLQGFACLGVLIKM